MGGELLGSCFSDKRVQQVSEEFKMSGNTPVGTLTDLVCRSDRKVRHSGDEELGRVYTEGQRL
jgi:hypothetical protein